MFDANKNRFVITQSECRNTTDMLLFNIYEQMCATKPLSVPNSTQDKPKTIEATIKPKTTSAVVGANKRGRKTGVKSG